jgi:hypothetical protein
MSVAHIMKIRLYQVGMYFMISILMPVKTLHYVPNYGQNSKHKGILEIFKCMWS